MQSRREALKQGALLASLMAATGGLFPGPVSYTHLTLPTTSRV